MTSWFVLQWLTIPFALATTFALVPPIKTIAQRFTFVSKIDFRRRELVPRPLLGGIAIFIGCLVANLCFNTLPLSLVLPGLGLVVLGVVDDRFQINPKAKLFFEIVCVGLWLWMTPIENLILFKIGVPAYIAYALHAFWVVGLINAFNMIDGMDGLASGMAALGFAFLGFFLPPSIAIFAWSLSACCLGHLFYNRPPASIFLGDSGSLLLGFLLSALGSTIVPAELHTASILIPLFILAHPEIDAILAMIRRKRAGTPLFQGDKDHIHHKLRRIGLGANGSLAVTYFASIYCGLTAVLLDNMHASSWIMGIAALLCIFGVSTILVALYFIEYRLASQFSQLGTPMLQQHINITLEPNWPISTPYQAVVFDLLPYYKEMQERGISDLKKFVNDFSRWINLEFTNCQIVPAGSYSIVVVSPAGIKRDTVLAAFKTIVADHNVLKNSVGIPWGLHFYTDSTDAQVFESKYGMFLRSRMIELRKAA